MLIVDDEPIAINSVEYIIKNNFKELQVDGKAKSGREAIERAYDLKPDIVLIDIKMPGINGLDAIRKIKDTNPDIYFIIMSAYDYFDYATEAMALGAVEYLLKPIKEDKLIEALKKAICVISQKRERVSLELELKEKLEIIVPTLESGFIHTLCMAEDNTEELINFSRLLEMENKGGYVMAIEFSEKNVIGKQNKIGVSVKTHKHYVDYRDILKSMCKCIVGPIMLNRLIVFILDEPKEDIFDIKTSATKLAKTFSDRICINNRDVLIGIGRYYKSVLDAKKSYKEAMQALLIVSSGDDSILHIDDMIQEYKDNLDFEEKLKHEILTKAAKGDINSTLLAIDNIFSRILEDARDLNDIKNKCIVLAVDFTKHLGSLTYDLYTIISKIMNTTSSNDLRDVLKSYVKHIVDELSAYRQKKISSIIEKADNYIQEHYAEDIKLEEIARVVNLSPYYFSRFYKEISGINFIERLINIRIEKAKNYFENTDLSIKEISGMVGYSDPNYFSKLFKKTTGCTATEYREYYRK